MNGPRRPYRTAALLLPLLAPILGSCSDRGDAAAGKQVIMLGFDGLDPKLCRQMLEEGLLPNFARLGAQGSFLPLGTSTPPQSPVAWSSIITGTNPGEHGIFDFIHRDPTTYFPDFSTSKNEDPGWPVKFGDWMIPLKSGRVVNLRRGKPFWEFLTENGVNAHVYRIPANYPPEPAKGSGEYLTLTDMGTPDLVGSVGEFSFYTTGAFKAAKDVSGGKIHHIRIRPFGGDVARGSFYGPPDGLLNPEKVGKKKAGARVETPFTIYRDKANQSAVIEWQDKRVLLAEGEWSDWRTVEFSMGPSVLGWRKTLTGLIRLYLRQVAPTIELYVSPIQISPEEPAMPVSVPDDFAAQVAGAVGPYYTQGLPEDTQALRHDVLTRDEFLEQAELIFQERLKLLDFAMDRFEGGFLFFYFGSTDQIGHMFWSTMAASHPAISAEQRDKYRNVMRDVYARMDEVVGKVTARFPDALIMCISDHGFADFARGFNLNTWLVRNGYAELRGGRWSSDPLAVNAAASRAYAMGINGLYINLKGREKSGTVDPADKQALMDEITGRLLEVRDPSSGAQVIKEVYQADKVYAGPQIAHGPDMQIGYALGYRGSWSTALGGAPEDLIEDNTEAWCGDHCIATDLVPGVIFTSRPVELSDPTIEDLAPTILKEFGITPPDAMSGASVFERRSRSPAG